MVVPFLLRLPFLWLLLQEFLGLFVVHTFCLKAGLGLLEPFPASSGLVLPNQVQLFHPPLSP